MREGFQQCFGKLPEAVLLVSTNGQILEANAAAEELLCRPLPIRGSKLADLVEDPPEKVGRLLELSSRSRDLLPGALVFKNGSTDGIPCRVEGGLFGLTEEGGFLLMRVFPKAAAQVRFRALNERIEELNREILRRKQTEAVLNAQQEQLRRANEDLRQFAYLASHDLQEPLRMVAVYSQLLKKNYTGQINAQADLIIQQCVDGALRMERMIEDLLAYTHASVTPTTPTPAISLNQIFDSAVMGLKIAIQESSASISSDPLPTLKVEPVHFQMIFQNLLSNALKYRGNRPPVIHVSAHREPQHWVISVADNGIGIEPNYREQIFGLFKRLHTRELYPGTGLGLAICKKLMEHYGGRIWVESEFGNGSTFFFSLLAEDYPE